MDIEVLVPDIGLETVEVTEILVNVGDYINKDDSIISVEGKKSVLEIPSSFSGKINKIYVSIGDKLSFKDLILTLEVTKKNHNNIVEIQRSNILSKKSSTFLVNQDLKNSSNNYNFINKKNIYSSPNIRRLARLYKIDLSKIIGSGRKGRIIKEDIYKVLKYTPESNMLHDSHIDNKFSLSGINSNINIQSLPLSKIQIHSAKNLSKSWSNIPHVTQFNEADITELENFRKKYNNSIQKNKDFKKISLLSFIVRIIVEVLSIFPRFNSVLDIKNKCLMLKKNINIGIAVETGSGLVVPVLKDIKYKKINFISIKLLELIQKTKNNKLQFSDMTEGTFTISSLGGIGGTNFTPIINPPEVCILGISKATIKPIWKNNEFKPCLVLPFSISYDHRAIDGADAARFTSYFKNILEDIRILLM